MVKTHIGWNRGKKVYIESDNQIKEVDPVTEMIEIHKKQKSLNSQA